MDVDIKHHSQVVYGALCEIIGGEDVVTFNRTKSALRKLYVPEFQMKEQSMATYKNFLSQYLESLDFPCMFQNNEFFNMFSNTWPVDSGSRAEGFDLPSSDYDMMFVLKYMKVIQSPTQESSSQSHVVLYAEKDYTRPGFVRLKVLNIPLQFSGLSIATTKLCRNYYISSRKLLQIMTNNFSQTLSHETGIESIIHGPCMKSTIGKTEWDNAWTLSSEMWPIEAVGCVHRLLMCGWPSYDVIKDMVSDGCLFVPIGCKTSPYVDIEWRMSFSLAEKRLVHSMNHTQFLTYGLLKLFLKEVVEECNVTKGLLCSYFMKTLVFWEIVETHNPWTPSYLLQNVWNCFRRLLSWIINEYCPNFFIKENNMFFGKIHGRTRQTLQSLLHRHYKTGYLTFTEIPSIRNEMYSRGAQKRLMVCNVLSRSLVIKTLHPIVTKVHAGSAELHEVLQSSKLNFLEEYISFLRLYEFNLVCFKMLCSEISQIHHNKTKYLKEKSFYRLIKLSSPDYVQGRIFLAVYSYRRKRYDSCIRLLNNAIQKLEDERTIYTWEFASDKYSSLGGDEMSISEGIYKFTASNVPLDADTCVPEISDECNAQAASFTSLRFLFISPSVLSHFLLCLCHFWKGDLTQARVRLKDIRHCLQHSQHQISRDKYLLSWQILGIGQEILGDFRNALVSYSEFKKCSDLFEIMDNLYLMNVNEKRSSRLTSLLRSQERLSSQPRRKRPRQHLRTQRF